MIFEEEIDQKVYQLFISQIPDAPDEFNRFLERLDSSYDFQWENHSWPDKIDNDDLKTQIEKAEVVVVLSGFYSLQPDLIRNIYALAGKLEKPVVLIRPYGMENVPQELEEKSKAVIGWNAHCIVGAIKGALGLGDEDEFCEID